MTKSEHQGIRISGDQEIRGWGEMEIGRRGDRKGHKEMGGRIVTVLSE